MTEKFTPAPWLTAEMTYKKFQIFSFYNSTHKKIATVEKKQKDNANLIAAAPELYAALVDAVELIDGNMEVSHFDTLDNARKALAKARGD